jgi:hypothetical protein
MTAQGTTSVSWAENKTTAPAKTRGSFAHQLQKLFRKVAEAITGQPAPSYRAARKKRTEETRGSFKLVCTIIRRIHRPPPLPERLWLSDTLDWLRLWNWSRSPNAQLDHFDYGEQHYPTLDP